MMARARVDVDALNQRARTAALADGTVHGPVLVVAGGRTWQAGDLLRACRNDRRLPLGDGHVRNGDRFRVLGPAPGGGLLVADLAGQASTTLPEPHLAQHATYGWACTIDGAQGATADLGILLARPGMDREHLYVGMTRGRHANHVHLTTEPPTTTCTGHVRSASRQPWTTPSARSRPLPPGSAPCRPPTPCSTKPATARRRSPSAGGATPRFPINRSTPGPATWALGLTERLVAWLDKPRRTVVVRAIHRNVEHVRAQPYLEG
ncbi:MAG: hypothetical protein ABI807_05335 [Sporichthyaceae bacterium]